MSLSCSCDVDGEYDWYYDSPSDYSELDTIRARRCSSCKCKVKPGSTVARFYTGRPAKNGIEERIYGDDCDAVPKATLYLCEECADIYFSLSDLGFDCVSPTDNMRETASEYHALYQTNPPQR